MSEVTRLIDAAGAGDRKAAADLLPLVYEELRRLAAANLAREPAGQTLDPTALVHEAYLRLVAGARDEPRFDGPPHFFAAAAGAMRRILVEAARRKGCRRKSGRRRRVPLVDVPAGERDAEETLALDAAVTDLAAEDEQAAAIAQMHLYAGLPITKAAEVLGVSRAQAYRQWTYARAWLRCRLDGDSAPN